MRLAWHSSGTYDKMSKTGGSQQGTIRFKEELAHGGNAGLDKAVAWMEPIKQAVPEMSYADLYTLSGIVAVKTLGGPAVPWKAGRVDSMSPSDVTPDGRLPGADNGSYAKDSGHLRDIFYRMGFNDQEIVALSGAHSVGFCHTDRSGYWGPWSFSPNMFSNEYYRLLLDEEWTVKKHHNNGHWDGPLQYEDPSGNLMMLPSDMTLKYDNKFKKYALEYKNNEEKFFTDFAAAFKKLTELGVKFD